MYKWPPEQCPPRPVSVKIHSQLAVPAWLLQIGAAKAASHDMDQTTPGWTERVVAPDACHTMSDLRAQIDRLDRALVRLIAERQGYIERAAEIKEARDTVRDEAQIADVIAKVLDEAGRARLSAEIAGPVWRELVERSIAHEFAAFDARPRAGKAAHPPR